MSPRRDKQQKNAHGDEIRAEGKSVGAVTGAKLTARQKSGTWIRAANGQWSKKP